jgi:hypothetical protein
MKKTIILGALILLLISLNCQAQKKHPKFGKFTDEEISMTIYDKDTSASAVVLWDIGRCDFDNNLNERFTRIKILKKEGYEHARFQILIRNKGERLGTYSASTFNMEDGKMVRTKLDKDLVITEKYNRNYDIMKFEMPVIKVGSIIDIEYTIMSDFLDVPNWDFQTDIPVVYSEYVAIIPEFYQFKQLEKGYFPIGNRLRESRSRTINTPGYQPYSFREDIFTYFSENVPAFHEEAFIDCAENYTSAIQFEIGSIVPRNGMIRNYTQTWEAIGDNLMKDSDFGNQLGLALFLNDIADQINQKYTEPKDKLAEGYSYIQNYMTWNKSNGFYSYQGLRKAFNEKKGNAGDINLMLVALLKKLNLTADPVILSTRKNGKIHPAQLIIDQYNYVIASVLIDGKRILLDATDKFTPPGILPERCLNEQGRLINEKGGDWVAIKPNATYKATNMVNMKIDPENTTKGTLITKEEEYAAITGKSYLQNYSEDSKYLEDLNKNDDGIVYSIDSITGRNVVGVPLVSSFSFESEKVAEQAGNLLMINPFIIDRRKTNPFKLEERNYPVDYSYPYSRTYMATIELPEGYTIESMPETKKIANTDKTAQFMMSAQQVGNKISIMWKFDIKKVVYLPEEYSILKEFYNQIIDSESKQIVLKKL